MLSQHKQTGRICKYNTIKIYLSKNSGTAVLFGTNYLGNTNTSRKAGLFHGTIVKVTLLFFFSGSNSLDKILLIPSIQLNRL